MAETDYTRRGNKRKPESDSRDDLSDTQSTHSLSSDEATPQKKRAKANSSQKLDEKSRRDTDDPRLLEWDAKWEEQRAERGASPTSWHRLEDVLYADREDVSEQYRASGYQSPPWPNKQSAAIGQLRAYVDKLHDFIGSSELASKAPESVLEHLQKHLKLKDRMIEPKVKAAAVRSKIETAYNSLDADYTMTGDDFSWAMAPFLADVEEVASMDGEESTRLAIHLMMYIIARSYSATERGMQGEGSRPSDEPADILLCRLLTEMRRVDPGWDLAPAILEDLSAGQEFQRVHDLDHFFERSIKLLEDWEAASPETFSTFQYSEAARSWGGINRL